MWTGEVREKGGNLRRCRENSINKFLVLGVECALELVEVEGELPGQGAVEPGLVVGCPDMLQGKRSTFVVLQEMTCRLDFWQ